MIFSLKIIISIIKYRPEIVHQHVFFRHRLGIKLYIDSRWHSQMVTEVKIHTKFAFSLFPGSVVTIILEYFSYNLWVSTSGRYIKRSTFEILKEFSCQPHCYTSLQNINFMNFNIYSPIWITNVHKSKRSRRFPNLKNILNVLLTLASDSMTKAFRLL